MNMFESIYRLAFGFDGLWSGLLSIATALILTKLFSDKFERNVILQFVAYLSVMLPICAVLVLGRGDFEIRTFQIGLLSNCFSNGNYSGTSWSSLESLLNVAIYIPFGLSWVLVFRRPFKVLIVGVLFALALEGMQAVMDLGVCEWVDPVRNMIGLVVGAGFGMVGIAIEDDQTEAIV